LAWFAKSKKAASGLLGIETGPDGISLAWVDRPVGQSPKLVACQFSAAAPAEQPAALKRLAAELGLAGMPVNLVLNPSQYQMFLLESPEVAADELRAAMRWKVNELIPESLDDVVVDAFALPADAYRGRSRMAYCAVLGKARMLAYGELIEQAGLELASIDITEMAFRNLGLLAGAEGVNIGLLSLRASEGLICVQNGADLYMARRIEQGTQQAGLDAAGVTLEIQRSLDYFESQLGKGYINRLLLLPMKEQGAAIRQALGGGLAVNLQPLELGQLFADSDVASSLAPEQQAACMAAVGAALRVEAG
jgi:MSHA biogenesis protein MshI